MRSEGAGPCNKFSTREVEPGVTARVPGMAEAKLDSSISQDGGRWEVESDGGGLEGRSQQGRRRAF